MKRPSLGAPDATPGVGIRAQILVAIIGVVALGFAIVYLVTTPLLEGAMREEHRDRTHNFTASVAATLGSIDDADALDPVLERFSVGLCLAVADARGTVSPAGLTRLGACVGEADRGELLELESGHRWLMDSGSGERVAIVVPVDLGHIPFGPGKAARLIAVQNIRGIKERVAAVRVLLLLFLGLAIGLTTLIGFGALTRLIVRPIARLGKAIERVHAGEIEVQAPEEGGRELRSLARSFNRLARKLSEDEQRIVHQLSELRVVNSQLDRTQEHLVRSEKLASVGQLAAGVAHEIGNPMAIALGYLELMKRDDTTDAERRDYTARSIEAIQRVSEILRDLLDFSRPNAGREDERGDAVAAMQHCVQLLSPQPRLRHATLEVVVDADRLPIAIAEHRLVQVLVNLVLNAADATLDREGARIYLMATQASDRVHLRVTDNGPGIPEAIRRQIFDPFFTTKDPGKGTGLGLSLCYSILNAVGGDILVERTDETGTTFLLDLPSH